MQRGRSSLDFDDAFVNVMFEEGVRATQGAHSKSTDPFYDVWIDQGMYQPRSNSGTSLTVCTSLSQHLLPSLNRLHTREDIVIHPVVYENTHPIAQHANPT